MANGRALSAGHSRLARPAAPPRAGRVVALTATVDAVVIGTSPKHAEGTMQECADFGIEHVWMHRSFGQGSVSHEAADYGREHGITVIEGGCPCMFDPTADFGHTIMRAFATIAGNVPRKV